MVNDPIRIRFTLSGDEIIEAVRDEILHSNPPWRRPVMLSVVLFAVVVLSALKQERVDDRRGIILTGLLVAPAIGWMYGLFEGRQLRKTLPRRVADGWGRARRDLEQTFRFWEEGFDVTSSIEESRLDWAAWTGLREIERQFLIYPTGAQGLFIILPKRAFDSPADMDAFRNLADRKLKPVP